MLAAWIFSFSLWGLSSDSLTSAPITELNLQKAQYFPHYSPARKEIFFTSRGNQSDEELQVATWNGEKFIQPQAITSLNQDTNEGTATLSQDGNTLIFSGCEYRNSFGGCDLYESNWVNGGWTKPRNLGILINSHDWEGQPYLSQDGKKLYFSSDRPGGQGKRDLWMSEKDAQGRWKMAKNLGAPINSPSDEQGPYYLEKRDVLLFSSDKKGGKGGLDYYQSLFESGQWTVPKNVLELNSSGNEAGICLGINENEYFISRNKVGQVTEEELHRIIIPHSIWLEKKVIAIQVEPKVIEVPKIKFQDVSFDDIQFASNQWTIPTPIPTSLIKLVKFLNENPQQKIEIRGHTDEVGQAKSNQILSEKRANTIKTYLVNQGIDASRILTKGLSFLKPKIATNQTEARKWNRRIEIVLLRDKVE
ncbi:OmpA family protein [Aquirufa ecclesiirivi]|uniref:OmpA family protein n=1 Tax=Aquirufa ecclesiirivi TaxID=2715124 RepID=UPI001408CDF9|nr:OmpA family protein [Aquirufa ecclesiirivi]NHC50100.1 OmpA family protein [Aquirufa ecclesiirivi]